ncbi:MAG: hypothetical protein QXJ59_04405 [Thermofilaceae archaeon]
MKPHGCTTPAGNIPNPSYFILKEVDVALNFFEEKNGCDDRPLMLFAAESPQRLAAFLRWLEGREGRLTRRQVAAVARSKGVLCIFPQSYASKTTLLRGLAKRGLRTGRIYRLSAARRLPPRLREAVRGREWVAPRRRAKPEPAKLIDPKLPHYVFRHTLYTVEERSGSEAIVFRNKIIIREISHRAISLDKRFHPHEVAVFIAQHFGKHAPRLLEKIEALLNHLDEEEAEFLKGVAATLLLLSGGGA